MAFLLPMLGGAIASAIAGKGVDKIGKLLGFRKGGMIHGKGSVLMVGHNGEMVLPKSLTTQLKQVLGRRGEPVRAKPHKKRAARKKK